MAHHLWIAVVLAGLSLPPQVRTHTPDSGRNTLEIRGVELEVYFYPATGRGAGAAPKVLFAPGDLGVHGLAITIAQTIASWGYDVCGLDTRRYLAGFTGRTPLTVVEVMSDFRQLAAWMRPALTERIALVGWSEGAGLCLLATVGDEKKNVFSGLISFGMTETNSLAWRWSDLFSSLVKRDPHEPQFQSIEHLPQVSPSPLLMIQSTGDQYVSVEAAKRLFAAAKEPKRFVLIEARDHRFEGNQQELYRALREGLEWITQKVH
jgi:dienelactone hydrolase